MWMSAEAQQQPGDRMHRAPRSLCRATARPLFQSPVTIDKRREEREKDSRLATIGDHLRALVAEGVSAGRLP
jgi:hypothetical protein